MAAPHGRIGPRMPPKSQARCLDRVARTPVCEEAAACTRYGLQSAHGFFPAWIASSRVASSCPPGRARRMGRTRGEGQAGWMVLLSIGLVVGFAVLFAALRRQP